MIILFPIKLNIWKNYKDLREITNVKKNKEIYGKIRLRCNKIKMTFISNKETNYRYFSIVTKLSLFQYFYLFKRYDIHFNLKNILKW